MSLTVELSPEPERQLQVLAAREGRALEEFARAVLEERLIETQNPRGGGLGALMDQRLNEGPDLKEAESYPEQMEPPRLREVGVE